MIHIHRYLQGLSKVLVPAYQFQIEGEMALDASGRLFNGKPDDDSLQEITPSKQHLAKNSSYPQTQATAAQNQHSSNHNGIVFSVFLAINLLAALYTPIQDCDEVFNYWEPTHYLNHRYGLQTWEYAPEFSVRSWLYIVIHAVIGKFGSLLSRKKEFEFYFVRVVLGMVCALSETRLFSAISATFNPRIGIMFGFAIVFSPGMFHASVSYLPSSFSMYTAMMGAAAFMNWRGGLKTAEGIMWFGIGGIVGWPFSTALIIPLMAEDLFLASLIGEWSGVIYRYLDGMVRSVIILVGKPRP